MPAFPELRITAFLLSTLLLCACSNMSPRHAAPDPSQGEVELAAQAGWDARLLYQGDSGIWTVRSLQFLPRYGCPEVIGLDDRGRCTVLVSYSGKWTPLQTIEDGAWLGALAHVDLDPHKLGQELYVGGRSGRLYQIHPHHTGGFDTRLIVQLAGDECHTLVSGDLDPTRKGMELLVFTRSGDVWLVLAPRAPGAEFVTERVASLPGRVRDALLMEAPRPGDAPTMLVAMRAAEIAELRFISGRLTRRTVLRQPMGFGRLARGLSGPGEPDVVYASRDDGVILRLQRGSPGWTAEVIYAGPQGPRGLAAGRYYDDPRVESVAVFGYSREIQILRRLPGEPWTVETVFVDREKGHWLTAAEVDGRNATDELIGSGYGSRIVLLTRPPGYGLEGVPTAAAPTPAKDP